MQATIRTELKSAYAPYTAAHRYFYDVLGSPDCMDDSPLLGPSIAPPGWERRERGPWVAYLPGVSSPDAGWKVHVSALPTNAIRVVTRVLEHCWELGIPVKTLRSERSVLVNGAKYADPTCSGKVITAYPADPREAARLVDRLASALADEPGPGIPGELRVHETPIHLRYGAFVEGWYEGRDGRLRPGRREGSRIGPDPRGVALHLQRHQVPAELRRFVEKRGDARLDVQDVAVLHRSNGGAVYRARWRGGPVAIIKEAQEHMGLDAGGIDAVTRLRHECKVLRRLAGTGIAPEVLEQVRIGSSEFVVMEHIEGDLLSAVLVARHPGINAEPSLSGDAYTRWVEGTTCRLQEAVRTLASRGVSHGDLHPGNIIETVDRLVLIDLESASLEGHSVSFGVVAPGFSSGAVPDLADDLNAVERIRLMLLSPHTGVLHWRPELHATLERTGRADIARRPLAADPGAPPTEIASLVTGIRVHATPYRTDRLFPGDIAQFTTPGAGLGLLTGAAGVLLALRAVGAEVDATWLDWLAERSRTTMTVGGLGHGSEGIALALALLGRLSVAHEVAALALARTVPRDLDPWWEYGHSGRALAFAELAALLDDSSLDRAAEVHLEATLEAVARGLTTTPAEAGLCAGWGGVALALVAISDLTTGHRRSICLEAGLSAVLRESETCIFLGSSLFAAQGSRAMPYLGTGSLALGLAAQALLDRVGLGLDIDASQRARLEELIAGTRTTCRTPVVAGAGLLHGRSGLLAALRRLSGDGSSAVQGHEHRLDWYSVPLKGDQSLVGWASGSSSCVRVLLGHADLRLSTDLSTGSAGALVALAPRAADALHQVLRLPACSHFEGEAAPASSHSKHLGHYGVTRVRSRP